MRFLKYLNLGVSNTLLYGYSEKFNLPPRVMELIISRGYKTEAEISKFLFPKKEMLYDPFLLKDMDRLISRIKKAITEKEKILIFGDYDVDGVSATAIMLKTLEKLGCKADFYLPNRFYDGYGLTKNIIEKIKNEFNPNLIITVDCGISNYEEIDYAKSLGVEIAVTDHHEIPLILPDSIVVNAKLPNQEYPFRELCGTGLAFKISQALLGDDASDFLPIATIATIADIVPLKDENRVIVKTGLSLMEKFLPIGLKMLFREQNLNPSNVNSLDIAFKIAPKLNASGRMGDAKDSLFLYLEKNPKKIKSLIKDVFAHNLERQNLCNNVYEDCKTLLKNENISSLRAIILASKEWDQGILGIVCARLVEEYNRPVFLFSKKGDVLKGSARSLFDVNVHALLSDLQDILQSFGGHTVAAGLTLEYSKFEEFKTRVNSYIFKNIDDKVFIPISYYDSEITISEIDENLVKSLEVLQPYGCENQPPKFKIKVEEIVLNSLKNSPSHANLIIEKKLNLIYFNYIEDYYKLKFSKEKTLIFEFQNSKFKNQFIKGILRGLEADFNLIQNSVDNITAFSLSQLFYKGKCGAKFKNFENEELLKFVSDCALSAFGTAFVFTQLDSLLSFTQNYNTENFYFFEMGENISNNGFNSIIFCPESFEFAKNFQRIIFVDGILDEGYLCAINHISNAEIFLSKNVKFSQEIFSKIENNRNNFINIYNIFKNLNEVVFENLQIMYNEFIKYKIKFLDFYCAFLVFKQLNLLEIIYEKNKFLIKINNSIKNPLTNSSIFNYVHFLKELQKK